MSIFRNTFQKDIKAQLEKRQESMLDSNRTPNVIQYLNSRNSWIRMTSSVNVGGSADLAKNNVLLGGTLVNLGRIGFSQKSGVGSKQSDAYSTKTPSGVDNRLGIRPMPGITNMEIRSKSAYGSLREAVVNFQCWDIRQLEDLELLYMRPGYTVLVEWGWLPYLDNNKNLVNTLPRFYDILNKGATNRTTIFQELYDKCTNSGGNYDAVYGYIKNYQWSARPDGGYDCQTTIISTGEIIESLKVNYILADLTRLYNSTENGVGFLDPEFENQGNYPSNKWKEHYEKNTLAGVWAEAYYKLNPFMASNSRLKSNSIFAGKNYSFKFPYLQSVNTNDPNSLTGGQPSQTYITLEAAFDIINKYVTPKDQNDNPLLEISLYAEKYATSSADPLLCVSHPTQISVDPSVCLIKSPLWYDTGGILYAVSGASSFSNAQNVAKGLKDAINSLNNNLNSQALSNFESNILNINSVAEYLAVEVILGGTQPIQTYFNTEIGKGGIGRLGIEFYNNMFNHLKQNSILGSNSLTFTTYEQTVGGQVSLLSNNKGLDKVTITVNASSQAPRVAAAIKGNQQAIANVKLLENLEPYFFGGGNGYDELGIIKNIYVNLDFLYKQALDLNLESSDSKEKNEISLYKYLKNIMSAIQASLGNINNFEIHVDPVDSKARIIDINFTERKDVFNNLFELQVHNTKSVVRNYSLQSQIFPEQSSIIAIGSQAKGGQLGIQNNTMIDFNKSIIDRIIPEKNFPNNNILSVNNDTTPVAGHLGNIILLYSSLSTPVPQQQPTQANDAVTQVQQTGTQPSVDLNILFTQCKNSLRDLIVYFQSITDSPGANRNIIPIKFSFTMDGIGGLVIGHLFKINQDILPKGYKGGGVGSKLAQTVTGISHTIGNGDWTTKIDALNIILGNKEGVPFESLKLGEIIEKSFQSIFNPPTSPTSPSNLVPSTTRINSFGSVSDIPLGARPLLDLIAYTEGTAGSGQNGYDIIVGGGKILNWNPNYTSGHPDQSVFIRSINNTSDAAGRYQFLKKTWDGLNFGAFNKANQDKAAWKLITDNGFTAKDATDIYLIGKNQIIAGGPVTQLLPGATATSINVLNNPKFLDFLDKTYKIWASLPNRAGQAGYANQGGKYSVADVYKIYIEALKKYPTP
jgi:muramidase (phage lysozyme)